MLIVGVFSVYKTHMLNTLTFSNTQAFDPFLNEFVERTLDISEDEVRKIFVDDPPKNSSLKTKRELAYLHKLASHRTSEDEEAIIREVALAGYTFGGTPLGKYFDSDSHVNTEALILRVLYSYDAVIHRLKQDFDRVRPSYLDPTLTTVIEVPQHASYPSGHSSEAHLIALVFSELDETKREEFWKDADLIAKHRELAGVHYPSDSTAGASLAKQYFEILKDTPWYQMLLEKAKAEWK